MCSRLQNWLTKQRKKCNGFCLRQDARLERTASSEFGDHAKWTPGTRHHKQPRRLLRYFWSERNINEEVEQAFLKQFLKEHGLYNKHQTIEQRRRLKQLLELEHRTLVFSTEQDPQAEEQQTLQTITVSRPRSLEFHSMHFPDPNPTPSCSVASRHVVSLPTLAAIDDGGMNHQAGKVTASVKSALSFTQACQRIDRLTWERMLVWKMVDSPYLETAV